MFRSFSKIALIVFIVFIGMGVLPACEVAAARSHDTGRPVAQLLTSDGTLDLNTGYSGSLDMSGYTVSLDPLRGPAFSPLMTTNAWNALGSEYDRRHDWANAENAYTHALSASDNAAIVLNNRGFSRLSQKKPELAIPDFVAALEKKPDLAPARNNLRLAMSMQGEYDRAIKGAAATDQAAVLNNAGFAAMLRGDYTKAKDLLTQAMKAKKGYYGLAAANLEMTQNLAKGEEDGHASSR